MIVSSEFNVKLAPPDIAVYNNVGLFAAILGVVSGYKFNDSDTAYGLTKIRPKSGNTKPYDPDPNTYPLLDNEPAVPFDPEINWNTLVAPIKLFTRLS